MSEMFYYLTSKFSNGILSYFFEIVKVTLLSFFSPSRKSLRKSTELCREDEPGDNHLDLEALRVDAVQTLKHVAHEPHHPVTSKGFFSRCILTKSTKVSRKPLSARPLCFI